MFSCLRSSPIHCNITWWCEECSLLRLFLSPDILWNKNPTPTWDLKSTIVYFAVKMNNKIEWLSHIKPPLTACRESVNRAIFEAGGAWLTLLLHAKCRAWSEIWLLSRTVSCNNVNPRTPVCSNNSLLCVYCQRWLACGLLKPAGWMAGSCWGWMQLVSRGCPGPLDPSLWPHKLLVDVQITASSLGTTNRPGRALYRSHSSHLSLVNVTCIWPLILTWSPSNL